jgi:hypothetical protein
MPRQKRKQHTWRTQLAKRRRKLDSKPPTGNLNAKIGFFARCGMQVVCDGDACVITGSSEELKRLMRLRNLREPDHTIQTTTFAEIHHGMKLGGAYCFDEVAYGRFLEPARAAGMELDDEDFSTLGPDEIHLVRLQYRAW